MSRNAKVVSLAVIAVVIVLIGRDVFLRLHRTFDCGDGPRRTIDSREFSTRYSSYSVDLEASIAQRVKISTKLTPVQLQQLSEAIQSAQDFRKYVVAGYNSCAVTKAQYSQYGVRFQALDNLAREIDVLAGKQSLTDQEKISLATLIQEYGELTQKQRSE